MNLIDLPDDILQQIFTYLVKYPLCLVCKRFAKVILDNKLLYNSIIDIKSAKTIPNELVKYCTLDTFKQITYEPQYIKYAIQYKRIEIIKYIADKNYWVDLRDVISIGDLDLVKHIVNIYGSRLGDERGGYVVEKHVCDAIKINNMDIIQYLLESGVYIYGESIKSAVINNNVDAARLIYEHVKK